MRLFLGLLRPSARVILCPSRVQWTRMEVNAMSTRSLPEMGFMRLEQVLKVFPVGRSSWWAGIKDGRYPRGVKLSQGVTAWKVDDIRALIERINSEG